MEGVPWQAHLAVHLRHAAHLRALLEVLVRGGAVGQQHRHDGGGQPAGCRSAKGGGAGAGDTRRALGIGLASTAVLEAPIRLANLATTLLNPLREAMAHPAAPRYTWSPPLPPCRP